MLYGLVFCIIFISCSQLLDIVISISRSRIVILLVQLIVFVTNHSLLALCLDGLELLLCQLGVAVVIDQMNQRFKGNHYY